MYWVYILYSKSTDSYYKGQTNDLQERLHRHNCGFELYTKKGIPWTLIWSLQFSDRSVAMALEKKLKNLSRLRLTEFISKFAITGAGPDDTD